jgi:hypothetical protein
MTLHIGEVAVRPKSQGKHHRNIGLQAGVEVHLYASLMTKKASQTRSEEVEVDLTRAVEIKTMLDTDTLLEDLRLLPVHRKIHIRG